MRRRQWQRIHPGVFLVGIEVPTYLALILAAAAARSPAVAAGGLSAGWLNGMLEGRPSRVDITIPWKNGIPVISPVDTLFELATLLDPRRLQVAVARGLRAHVVSRTTLNERLRDSPARPGLAELKDAAADPRLTRSKYERILRRLITEAELHHGAEFNARVHGKELDVYWPEARLAIEIDAYSTHGDSASFEDDHRLDGDFGAGGIDVHRFTGPRIERAPYAVAARIAALLTRKLGGLPLPDRR